MDSSLSLLYESRRFLTDRNNFTGDGRTDDLTSETDDKINVRPGDFNDLKTSAPAASPLNDQEKVGFVMIAIMTVALCLTGYYCYFFCKKRRERRELELVNTRVDNVLGDMVMSSSFNEHDEDEEGDGELI
jgi:hypothetical protein